MNNETTGWKAWGIITFLLSLVPLGMGLYKMFAYDNGNLYPHNYVNVYVGGDAYNYIINANYATGWFVLFGVLLLASIGLAAVHYLTLIRNEQHYSAVTSRKSDASSLNSDKPKETAEASETA